jgi:arylformamidase
MARIFHDVTLELSPQIIGLPGDQAPRFEELKSIFHGDPYNLTAITLGSHTGTHIDVPKHFYDDGLTVERLDLNHLLGAARVIEIRGRKAIDRVDLQNHALRQGEIVLVKTDNSDLITRDSFDPTFTYLTPDAARYLVESCIKTLGFDYLSVEGLDNPVPEVHYLLLSNNIVIIEGLDLSRVDPGDYQIVALPLKIKGGNGSPTRVVLIQEK